MRELVIDSFAGGGGASLGIGLALGRPPDVAINHDPGAIEMHAANHPATKHYAKDVWKLEPRKVTRGRPVGLLWASPDCCHFSRAKGGKPVKKHIRGLAWMVIRWAVEVQPRVIMLENVREFAEWGPLIPRWECRSCQWRGTEGQAILVRRLRKCPRCDATALRDTGELIPDPDRKGLTFKRWAGRLRNLGYKVEWKVLNAADHGAPTHRRRLFLIARNDGLPIVWPEPTHGDPKKIGTGLFDRDMQPWRTAAECIDWSIPCPSIFLSRKEGRKAGVNRPLAEKTLQRIARGVKRYVLDNPRPFLVVCNHGGPEFRGQEVDGPLPTLTASRDAHGVVTPFLARLGLVAANLVRFNHDDAGLPVDAPMPTVTSQARHAALVYSLLTKHYAHCIGQALGEPLATAASRNRFGLVTVPVQGEPYVIVDIGMRMLRPRELARGQGFPDSYVLTGTATNQTARIGNSVPPVMARRLVEANYQPFSVEVSIA